MLSRFSDHGMVDKCVMIDDIVVVIGWFRVPEVAKLCMGCLLSESVKFHAH